MTHLISKCRERTLALVRMRAHMRLTSDCALNFWQIFTN
jgi:hypothetical protein